MHREKTSVGVPIRGFATICCLGDYRQVTAELLEALLDSRLYDRIEGMDLAVLGEVGDRDAVREMLRPFEKLRIGYQSSDVTEYEFPALGLLQDACRDWSGNVFYLHTKGVSRSPLSQHARYWRALMLDQVVRNHHACTDLLRECDTAGTNWRGNHYSGNFWWARSEHIVGLPDIRALRSSPRAISEDPVWNQRLQCEFWVGMRPGRFGNLGVRELDLYQTISWTKDTSSVINDLLGALGGNRYAEIVTAGPSAYLGGVVAGTKHSYDQASGRDPDRGYDVVLVDGWHDETECFQDLMRALEMVGHDGAVLVHDTNPPTAWHQRGGADYAPGTEWNGTAWRAVRRFRLERPDTWVHTVDTDWGCTVIIPGLPATMAGSEQVSDLVGDEAHVDWEWFQHNRDSVLNLVSPSRFRRVLYAVPFALGRRTIATRTEVLNLLASWSGLDRYLEIGVGGGENFEGVIAPIRHSVDPQGGATFQMTSDAFFASGRGCSEYDLVFIDGLHEEEQVLRDIENALGRLSPRGRIVLHDANPPTAWHQRPRSQYDAGEDWNGTVWKGVVRFRALHPELTTVTLDVDWGCTVISRSEARQAAVEVPGDLSWEHFVARREELLNLRPPLCAELTGSSLEGHRA
jgi:Methyltransferase domain